MAEDPIDYDWIEREMLDQELSTLHAAQRDESDAEMEEEPHSDEESILEKEIESLPVSNKRAKALPKLTTTVDDEITALLIATDKSKKNKGKPFDECFFRYPIPRQKQLSVTLANGDRVFCGVKSKSDYKSVLEEVRESEYKMPSLVDPKTFAKIESEVELKVSVERRVREAVQASEVPVVRKPIAVANPSQSSKLPLVQRFKPSRFIDLLSHEKRNRDALKWLRSWDKIPQDGMPVKTPKVLLLAGPPGSGKTTLAHVLAHHAGYRVVEINASDERTASGLKEKLASATEMQSVLDGTGKSNLVVLDEIDGISDGVQAVVQYVSSQSRIRPLICTCNDAYAPVLRPLRRIALVLSVNQPSRPRLVKRLREVCAMENVDQRPGALELLAMRMDNDLRACLNALDFWIRSTSTNQGEENNNNNESEVKPRVLDVEGVKRLPAFAKDGTADLWGTWKQVLSGQIVGGGGGGNNNVKSSNKQQQNDAFSVISRHAGDIPLVVDGIHENYLRCKFMDPSFKKTFKASEWMSFVDIIQSRVAKDLDFSFQSYAAMGCVGVGKAIAGGTPPTRMMFPLAASSFRQTKMRNEECLKEFFLVPETNSAFNKRHFPSESLPFLLPTLVPKVRPVPVQAMSSSERTEIDRVVEIMSEFGLTWMFEQPSHANHNNHGAVGKTVGRLWTLDPPVDKLAIFKEATRVGVISTDLARSLNARLKKQQRQNDNNNGVGEEGFRLISNRQIKKDNNVVATDGEESSTNDKPTISPSSDKESATNKRQKVIEEQQNQLKKNNNLQLAVGVKRDFFGRIIVDKKSIGGEFAVGGGVGGHSKGGGLDLKNSDFVFRFNEGLTDAVRRVVKMQDLL